jgi:DNA-binding IclR family transcriptional regulator
VDEILAANADVLAEKYPSFSPAVLRGLVRDTRARGYAINPGMILSDSWAIGVAIRGSDDRPIGALSIAATESRLSEERQRELVPLLKKEATWIEKRLREADSVERQAKGSPRRAYR